MRSRISLLVLATTSAVVVSFVIPLCLLVRTLAEDRAMNAADQEARNIAILVARLHDHPTLADLVTDLDRRAEPSTDVLLEDGSQLGNGARMRRDADVRRARTGEGFAEVDDGGGRVLLPVITPRGTAVVRTSVDTDTLHAGVTTSWVGIIGLGVVLLGLSYVVASRFGRRIAEPVADVAGTAHRLREGDLSARAPVDGPTETRELGHALNGLAERIVELLANERAMVGDLSHRLRTPVTALRLDAEAVDDTDLSGRLQLHIAVLQRTIDAIVKDARRPIRSDLAPRCDATQVAYTRLEFWRPLAEDQGRQMDLVLPRGPTPVRLSADDLRDVLDVLVDNVFAHTAEGVALRVELNRSETCALLVVADAGCGLPSTGTEAATGGTGLGLDIAARTARSAGGDIRFGRAPEGGTEVEVTLPLVED